MGEGALGCAVSEVFPAGALLDFFFVHVVVFGPCTLPAFLPTTRRTVIHRGLSE